MEGLLTCTLTPTLLLAPKNKPYTPSWAPGYLQTELCPCRAIPDPPGAFGLFSLTQGPESIFF